MAVPVETAKQVSDAVWIALIGFVAPTIGWIVTAWLARSKQSADHRTFVLETKIRNLEGIQSHIDQLGGQVREGTVNGDHAYAALVQLAGSSCAYLSDKAFRLVSEALLGKTGALEPFKARDRTFQLPDLSQFDWRKVEFQEINRHMELARVALHMEAQDKKSYVERTLRDLSQVVAQDLRALLAVD